MVRNVFFIFLLNLLDFWLIKKFVGDCGYLGWKKGERSSAATSRGTNKRRCSSGCRSGESATTATRASYLRMHGHAFRRMSPRAYIVDALDYSTEDSSVSQAPQNILEIRSRRHQVHKNHGATIIYRTCVLVAYFDDSGQLKCLPMSTRSNAAGGGKFVDGGWQKKKKRWRPEETRRITPSGELIDQKSRDRTWPTPDVSRVPQCLLHRTRE